MDAMTILVLEEVESELAHHQRILETIPGVRFGLFSDPAAAAKLYAEQKIDVLVADHQNKVDVGLNIAREWFDAKGVEAIFDITNSGVALALVDLAKPTSAAKYLRMRLSREFPRREISALRAISKVVCNRERI